MQPLKNIVINAVMILVMLFGFMPAALAVEPSFEEVKARAEQGYANSQALLGLYYRKGEGVRQDHSKAFYWFNKSADQGDSNSQYFVGRAYSEGKGVRQDHSKAFYWFKKSADQNNDAAPVMIGIMYEYGNGVRQNKTTAKEWYGKSCDNGNQVGCDSYKELNEQGY